MARHELERPGISSAGGKHQEWFEKRTFGTLLDDVAERFPDRVGLSFEDRQWTFSQLRIEARRVAASFIAAGVRPGETIGLWMPNRPEWLAAAWGAFYAGAVLLPVNTSLRVDDLSYILAHSGCTTLVCAAASGPVRYLPILAEALAVGPGSTALPASLRRVVVVEDGEHLDELGAAVPESITWADFVTRGDVVAREEVRRRAGAVSPDARALVMYTSGTTGTPKGVLHSHHAVRNVTDQANRLGVTESDALLMFLPLFHAYGLYSGPLLSLITGARMVLMPRFDAGEALQAIEAERVTMCFGFSVHFTDMMAHPAFDGTDRRSLRVSINAVGSRSFAIQARAAVEHFGGRFVSGYGMTEIGSGSTLGFLDDDVEHGAETSGYPLPGYQFKVVDPAVGTEVARGEPGEVFVRTYQATEGYLNDPVRTAALIDDEGWVHTGDMGVIGTDGYLQIVGRYKDILRVGGENVDPSEVEALFLEHPAVQAAVLVGRSDDRLGEVPVLCTVLASEAPAGCENELLHLAEGRLAWFKRPVEIVPMDELPLTATGKVRRDQLRLLVEQHGATLSDVGQAR
jgi:fatty-acyl-CoA synthase